MELSVVVHREPAGYWAEVDDLPGCFASGRTLTELHDALAEAVGLYLWDLAGELAQDELTVGRSTIEVTPTMPEVPE